MIINDNFRSLLMSDIVMHISCIISKFVNYLFGLSNCFVCNKIGSIFIQFNQPIKLCLMSVNIPLLCFIFTEGCSIRCVLFFNRLWPGIPRAQ